MVTENVVENVRTAVENATSVLYKEETNVMSRALELDSVGCALEDNASTIRALVCELVDI